MDYILGIDIGTGSTKAVAVALDGIAFDSDQNFYPTEHFKPQYSEQDPERVWLAFRSSTVAMISKLQRMPLAISLSSAMHSLIVVDEHCNAIAPMMTWADSRSAAIAEELLASPAGIPLYQETGTPIHAMSPLCKIIWIRENQPDIFKKAYKFISIKEYIWYRLFGTFEVDHSIASCSGLFHVEQAVWSKLALAAAGIHQGCLSELVSTTYMRKDFKPCPGLELIKAGTPFIIGASDGCLANVGTGAIQPGIAALTIGTSGAVRVAVDKAQTDPQSMNFCYRLDEQTFINGGPVNNGGIALKWHLKNLLQKEQLTAADYVEELGKIEAIGPGAAGLIFLPYLQGERAPIWDSNSCAAFFGIRMIHQPPHFTRAVIEGVCFALNDVLEALEASGQLITQLNVSGGFVVSPVWLQILADITGKTLVIATVEDASAVGAAYMAMKAIGYTSAYPQPVVAERETVAPDLANYRVYQRYFRLYKQLYQQLNGVMADLNQLQQQAI